MKISLFYLAFIPLPLIRLWVLFLILFMILCDPEFLYRLQSLFSLYQYLHRSFSSSFVPFPFFYNSFNSFFYSSFNSFLWPIFFPLFFDLFLLVSPTHLCLSGEWGKSYMNPSYSCCLSALVVVSPCPFSWVPGVSQLWWQSLLVPFLLFPEFSHLLSIPVLTLHPIAC